MYKEKKMKKLALALLLFMPMVSQAAVFEPLSPVSALPAMDKAEAPSTIMQSVVFTNTSNAKASMNGLTIGSPYLVYLNRCVGVPAGKNCVVTVGFGSRSRSGMISATLASSNSTSVAVSAQLNAPVAPSVVKSFKFLDTTKLEQFQPTDSKSRIVVIKLQNDGNVKSSAEIAPSGSNSARVSVVLNRCSSVKAGGECDVYLGLSKAASQSIASTTLQASVEGVVKSSLIVQSQLKPAVVVPVDPPAEVNPVGSIIGRLADLMDTSKPAFNVQNQGLRPPYGNGGISVMNSIEGGRKMAFSADRSIMYFWEFEDMDVESEEMSDPDCPECGTWVSNKFSFTYALYSYNETSGALTKIISQTALGVPAQEYQNQYTTVRSGNYLYISSSLQSGTVHRLNLQDNYLEVLNSKNILGSINDKVLLADSSMNAQRKMYVASGDVVSEVSGLSSLITEFSGGFDLTNFNNTGNMSSAVTDGSNIYLGLSAAGNVDKGIIVKISPENVATQVSPGGVAMHSVLGLSGTKLAVTKKITKNDWGQFTSFPKSISIIDLSTGDMNDVMTLGSGGLNSFAITGNTMIIAADKDQSPDPSTGMELHRINLLTGTTSMIHDVDGGQEQEDWNYWPPQVVYVSKASNPQQVIADETHAYAIVVENNSSVLLSYNLITGEKTLDASYNNLGGIALFKGSLIAVDQYSIAFVSPAGQKKYAQGDYGQSYNGATKGLNEKFFLMKDSLLVSNDYMDRNQSNGWFFFGRIK